MIDVGKLGNVCVRMPRMATYGANRATKPNRPKIKLGSDNFATSGQGVIVLDQMIIIVTDF